MTGNKTRFGVVSLLVMASVLGGIALTDTASAQSLSFEEMTTTRGEELTEGSDFGIPAVAEGQDVEITVGYQGIPATPSSPQTIKVTDNDNTNFDFGGDDELASTTITDSSGEVTLRIPHSKIDSAIFDDILARVDTEVKWVSGGDTKKSVIKEDEFGIEEEPTTIYIDSDTVPNSVNEGESATVEFYGWSENNNVFGKLITAGGSTIKLGQEVSSDPDFTDRITFTPSDHTNAGSSLDIQMNTQVGDGPKSNVESISISEANINSVSQPSGTFTTGEDVSATVTVTNAGQQGNTFFVGYSVVAPNGDIFDNQNTTGKTVTFAPGETKTVTVEWTVQSAAQSGRYDTIVSVWKESDPTNLQTRLDMVRKQDAFTVGTNQAPTASFTFSPSSPTTSDTVMFDASNSDDSDGNIQSYSWDFGDGSTATGQTASHSYSSTGDYTVSLTVTDDDGGTDTTTQTVPVGPGSSASIDDIQTGPSDTDGDNIDDRVEVDVTVSDVGTGQTIVRLGESNFDVDVSPTDTQDGNQEQFVTPQDTDGDGTNEAVEFVGLGSVSTTYTVVADLSNQADGETGTVTVELGGGTTASATYTIQAGTSNPFFDTNGNPVDRSTVIDRVVEWNLNGEIDGTTYTRQEIIDFVVGWNLAS
jgi:PKD repeat protein